LRLSRRVSRSRESGDEVATVVDGQFHSPLRGVDDPKLSHPVLSISLPLGFFVPVGIAGGQDLDHEVRRSLGAGLGYEFMISCRNRGEDGEFHPVSVERKGVTE